MRIQSSQIALRGSSTSMVKSKERFNNSEKDLISGNTVQSSGNLSTYQKSESKEYHIGMANEDAIPFEEENNLLENQKGNKDDKSNPNEALQREREIIQNMLNDMNDRIRTNRDMMQSYVEWAKKSREMIKDLFELLFGTKERTGLTKGISVESLAFNLQATNFNAQNSTYVERKFIREGFVHSKETVKFQAQGLIRTEDGREIKLDLNFHSQREESAYYYEEGTKIEKKLLDPLVLNVKDAPQGLSNVRIDFDLDCDGVMENISFAGEGTGFLHLDKNNDGIVNDGSELFGAKTGDGFKELSNYDGDKNGWIDENDAIFSKLKLWMLDKKGELSLVNLKEIGVGAIYLGRVNSQISLFDNREYRGRLKKSGIFLRENGTSGMVSQIDLIG